jgi:hypothetical protein
MQEREVGALTARHGDDVIEWLASICVRLPSGMLGR